MAFATASCELEIREKGTDKNWQVKKNAGNQHAI